MGVDRWGSWIFRAGAVSNFVVTLPAFIVYDSYVDLFAEQSPRYPFLVWIWSGMAFLWGVMFWEISTGLVEKRALIKYSYLEKSITSLSVLVAFAIGDVPGRFLVGILFTDVLWIPLFVWVHLEVARAAGPPNPVTRPPAANPTPAGSS